MRRHVAKHRVVGVGLEVHRHAQPREEGGLGRVDAGRLEPRAQIVVREVDRDEREVRRRRDIRRGQARALVALRAWQIDFEDSAVARPVRLPVRERVVAGAEQHVLPHAALDGRREPIFGKAAAHDDVPAQPARLR